jgi:hypothetical protein
MSQFEQLMAEIQGLSADQEQLTKALPADDGKDEEKIQAAAGEGGSDGEDGEGGAPAAGDGDADDKPMAKSFTLTLEDGTTVEAQDGAELVKALSDRIDGEQAKTAEMAKALEATVNLAKGFLPLIKSMQDQITKLSGEGRGRKAQLSITEKPAAGAQVMAKSEPVGMNHEQFFAKALTAQKEGRLSGVDIAVAEACLNRGEAIPPSIVARVVQ